MATKFFGVDIQNEIGSNMTASDMPNFLLRKKSTGVRDPANLSGGTNNTTPDDYRCHGWVKTYSKEEMMESPLIQRGDKKVLIIAKPLADANVEPEMDDFLVIDEEIVTIISAMSNSAKAVWICQCRG